MISDGSVKRVTAGSAVASASVDRMKMKMPERAAELREVWRSPLIPNDPIVWRADLDAETKKKLSAFLFSYGKDQRKKDILTALTWAGFVPSDNNQLITIRQIELVRERTKIENDTNVSADEKQKKLQDIDARLAELNKKLASAK